MLHTYSHSLFTREYPLKAMNSCFCEVRVSGVCRNLLAVIVVIVAITVITLYELFHLLLKRSISFAYAFRIPAAAVLV